MTKRFLLAALIPAVLVLSLGACGGEEEEQKTTGGAAALTGTWYSPAIGTAWTFNSSGTGQLRTKSFDGTSCQITDIEFTVNSANNAISYYGTRYQQKSNPARSDDYNVTTRRGPFSASYTLTGSSLSIGNGTYSAGQHDLPLSAPSRPCAMGFVR